VRRIAFADEAGHARLFGRYTPLLRHKGKEEAILSEISNQKYRSFPVANRDFFNSGKSD
jgi:hypothetical protein